MQGENATVICNHLSTNRTINLEHIDNASISRLTLDSYAAQLQYIRIFSIYLSPILSHHHWILSDIVNGILNGTFFMNGQALYIHRSSLLIHSSHFINTTGCNGGAIHCMDSVLRLDMTSFFHSRADCLKQGLHGKGGAVYAVSTEVVIIGCDFIGNTAI